MGGADVQVIVPAKRLSEAKSRLRPYLDDGDREALVLDMLAHVVRAARTASHVAEVVVVTPDLRIAQRALAHGARVLADDSRSLNASLREAMLDPPIARAAACLVLPGDLPCVTAGAIDEVLAHAAQTASLAVVPDQHRAGTNALAWRGPGYRGFRFGRDSFAAHRRAGRAAGFSVCALPARAEFFDLDDAEGLARMGGLRRGAPVPCLVETTPHA